MRLITHCLFLMSILSHHNLPIQLSAKTKQWRLDINCLFVWWAADIAINRRYLFFLFFVFFFLHTFAFHYTHTHTQTHTHTHTHTHWANVLFIRGRGVTVNMCSIIFNRIYYTLDHEIKNWNINFNNFEACHFFIFSHILFVCNYY